MTNQPTITGTRTYHGTRNHDLDTWLDGTAYGWRGDQLVLFGFEVPTYPQPGWLLVRWTDGTVTTASPRTADRTYGPEGLAGRLDTTRLTAAHWHQAAIDRGWTVTAHALTCVLAALNGETDPAQLGIDTDSPATTHNDTQ